ncbi:MAG: aminotransferase class V-fold PLP-dependent enzyme [Ruminococcaceae bacterium]|nr:aminotransferase class V-fold PLP-dependent enzyme [Oscillospiraceae bacterium]
MDKLIYFDNAATTFPKPDEVYRAVQKCIEEYCGNPGRSGHRLSLESARTVYRCRESLCSLFGLREPENVIFTLNTTYALNIAISSVAKKEDHVLISNIEHNSVIRPLVKSGCKYSVFNCFAPREKVMADIVSKITPKTRLIICSHQSNVSPLKNHIREIGKLARKRGITFIVDAAQSAGIYDINIERDNIDILCVPSHKGLYGIQGCGALLFSSRYKGNAAAELIPLISGGNGVNSLEETMPPLLPERLEAGTLPTPAIAGLEAGISTIREIGIETVREHEDMLYRRLRERLINDRRIIVYCKEFAHSNILLFNVKERSSIEITEELDREGICVRGGFHCSPLAHNLLNTGENGAVRVSFGAFNTLEEVDVFCNKLNGIIKS